MSNAAFFSGIRKVIGSLDQVQVDSINAIMREAHKEGVTNPDILGYFLSTGWNESRLRPVREGFKETDAAARAYVAKHYGHKYGKPAGPYGHFYYGRGFPQITWLDNYANSSADAGIDLVKYPDKALEPDISARLLVRGMIDGRWNGRGRGIAYYLDRQAPDWKNARRTVNITDKWEVFADTAKAFSAVIARTPWKPDELGTTPAPTPQPDETPLEETEQHWLARIIKEFVKWLMTR